MKKFLIYAPPFDENIGGAIALHKLADLLNRSGRQAYIYPKMPSFELHPHNFPQLLNFSFQIQLAMLGTNSFRVNPQYNTPVIKPDISTVVGDDYIVVYPEIIFGNPLQARNVVRWLLNLPGVISGSAYFTKGELLVPYVEGFRIPGYYGCTVAERCLTVSDMPVDTYLGGAPAGTRKGTAYCVRKGKGRPLVHDVSDSILIDGKSHAEIAAICRQVKTFISYDTKTTYSYLASLAGCDSIVVPEEGVSKETWAPEVENRYGVAYGFDDLEYAHATRHLMLAFYRNKNALSERSVHDFIADSEAFFEGRTGMAG